MMINSDEFAGRVAVVTGGSEGIGYDFCRALCEVGCEVYFCSRNAEKGEIGRQGAGKARPLSSDRPERAGPNQDFRGLCGRIAGHVDYLVNNAANDDRIKFDDVTVEACDRMWALNLRSFLLMSRACLELIRQGEGKSIVNISTTNYMFPALNPLRFITPRKAEFSGFTRSLARELGQGRDSGEHDQPGLDHDGKATSQIRDGAG